MTIIICWGCNLVLINLIAWRSISLKLNKSLYLKACKTRLYYAEKLRLLAGTRTCPHTTTANPSSLSPALIPPPVFLKKS
jgi:hypothetical protein